MAENKQYITKVQENGSVMISEDVLAAIVLNAVKEVEGIVGMSAKHGVEIAKKNSGKGLKIVIGENDEITVECNVIIGYGQSVVAVAKNVQEAVTAALESMTGVKVVAVNVNVCGIVRQ